MAFLAISQADVYVMSISGTVPEESKIKPANRCQFVVATINDLPKYVFRRLSNGNYVLIDGFTGLEIHESKTSFQNKVTTVSEFMDDLLS